MAFLYRVGQSKLKILSCQFRRYYIQLPYASSFNSTISHQKPRVMEMPTGIFYHRPTDICNKPRFFAAPVQIKPKKEEQDSIEKRLNGEIKAEFVRLVMDDGHSIVSRHEALERARKLKLDLVEVQRNANPPVCKIMDFNKEKHIQQMKDKERGKSKAKLTLRTGASKEMRFSAKTELKDLKMKADAVIKLMEKGYRVKCRAQGNEGQDLTGVLSQVSDLIDDVAIVESGPHSRKTEAYMIVRHVKFGPPKKGYGNAKKLRDVNFQKAVDSSDSTEEDENQSSVDYGSARDNDLDKIFGFSNDVKRAASRYNQTNVAPTATSPSKNNLPNFRRPAEVHDHAKGPATPREPPAATENRYLRAVPRNRYQQREISPNSPRPGYGPETQGVKTGMNGNREGNFHDSTPQPFSRGVSANFRRDIR
ncbi:hypothetical protein L6164_037660 [Bauhinia variegata]|uniref:Uncharacterized protein n=1 Tax=Bauhinia variegata TaxID=167791 RepID=A0ACB9KLA6_BAUVA|nr:hypothetical protein L6164_037660 [Bauhinia variegata]